MTLLVGVLLCLGVGLFVRLARRRRQRRVLETPDRLERLRRLRGPHATNDAAVAAAIATYQAACAAAKVTYETVIRTMDGYVPGAGGDADV